MIRPIYLLGTAELREVTRDIEGDSDEIQSLIDDMIDTMIEAKGIGLAAPQIGRTERVFVVDLSPMAEALAEDGLEVGPHPMVFINPSVIEESEVDSEFEEGCLSIPDIHEEVVRPESVTIQYLDRNFDLQNERFEGMMARVIQHEYDHLEGVLFIDLITAFRRRLLKRKLNEIRDGLVESDYPVFARGKGIISA
jgi:peptide deformylase